MSSTINPVHTPCKKCVFATYENITQTGCALNYIDIYRQQNIDIIEAYDEDNEFYVINNKKCIGYREPKWFDKFGDKAQSLDDKIKLYNEFNKLGYVTVINLQKFTPDELDALFHNLSQSQVSPDKVIFIRYYENNLSFSYENIEKILQKYNVTYPWRVQTMLDSTIEYRKVLHDIIGRNRKHRFILSIDGPGVDVSKLVNYADNRVCKELGQFLVLADSDKKCLLFGASVYRFGVIHNQDLLDNYDNYTIV